MPGLKQAGLLVYQYLKNYLEPFGYQLIPRTVGLWYHKTRLTVFCLYVNNFGIKYQSKNDVEYLCNAIGQNFWYTIDIEGKNYYGLNIEQNYKLGYVDISIPKSVPSILKNYNILLLHCLNTCHISILQYNMEKGQPTNSSN